MGEESQRAVEAIGAETEAAADGTVRPAAAGPPMEASLGTVDERDAEGEPEARGAENHPIRRAAYFVPEAPGFFFSAFRIRA